MKNFIFILSAFLFLLFPRAYSGQVIERELIRLPAGCIIEEGNILERRDCTVKWQNMRFSDAVDKIFWGTSAPSGISVAFRNAGEDEIRLYSNPIDFTVKNLLDEIIKFDTRYQWKETDGVVNVFPQNDYEVLDVRIPKFKVEKAVPSELREKLVETKQFRKYLKEKNLIDKVPDAKNKYGSLSIGLIGKISERHKVTLDLKNATVREILNAIVRQRGYSTWIYREYNLDLDGEIYRLYRLEL